LLFCIAPNVPTKLTGDPNRLKQIITNLVSNAIKFTEEGSIILGISTANSARENEDSIELVIKITDTGIGISPEMIEGLFVSFSQADSSITRKYGGTGLGLTICKRLAELMGGDIGVNSRKGVGSTFWFSFFSNVQSSPQHSDEKDLLKGLRILLASESDIFSNCLVEWSNELGYQLECLSKSEPVISFVYENMKNCTPFDFIIVDLTSNDSTYFWSIKKMEEIPELSKINILILSKIEDFSVAKRFENNKYVKTISKPNSPYLVFEGLKKFNKNSEIKNAIDRAEFLIKRLKKKQLRLLVAEDNKINQIVIEKMLNKMGAKYTLCNNGHDAFETIKQRPNYFDQVLMDCEMPVMDGYKATELIRQWEKENNQRRITIIAVTAHALKEFDIKSKQAGMDHFLTKPIDFYTLCRVIDQNSND